MKTASCRASQAGLDADAEDGRRAREIASAESVTSDDVPTPGKA
jgi:hypothetical protein